MKESGKLARGLLLYWLRVFIHVSDVLCLNPLIPNIIFFFKQDNYRKFIINSINNELKLFIPLLLLCLGTKEKGNYCIKT